MPLVLAETATPRENGGSAQVKGVGKNKDAGITRNKVFTIKLSESGDGNPPIDKISTMFQDMV